MASWFTVALLTLLSVTSFVDRQILVLLVEDLKIDLGISDVQFGVLVGPAFLITYNIVLLPLSLLVDKTNRKYLLFAGCMLWSAMTLTSGFAQSFELLLALRSGLAIGEALLAPIAISLIGDLFEREKRGLPTAIFVAGSTVGTTSATLFGAMAYSAFEGLDIALPFIGEAGAWRFTMIAVAIPGFVLGLVMLLFGSNPARRKIAEENVASAALVPHLKSHGVIYLLVCLATGLVLLASMSLAVWMPAYLMRHFGLMQTSAGYSVGSLSTVVSVVGLLALPLIANRLAMSRHRAQAMIQVTIGAIIIAIPALVLIGFAATLTTCLIGFGVVLLVLSTASALPTQLIQLYAPSALKGRITALVLFFMFLLSIGIGPVLIPVVAEQLFSGSAAIGQALALTGAIACVVALVLTVGLRTAIRRA